MKLIASALRLIFSGSRAEAKSCDVLSSVDWWQTATQDKIKAAIASADVHARDEHGSTPLMWAAAWGKPESLMALIEAGADVNARDEHGWTPLMWAAWGKPENVVALIEAGADVNARDERGSTPLMWAA